MNTAVSPVGWKDIGSSIYDVATVAVKAPLGAVEGFIDASKLYNNNISLPSQAIGYAKSGKSVGTMARNFFKWLFGDVVGKGAVNIRDSRFYGAIKEAMVDFSKIGTVTEKLGPAVVNKAGVLTGIGGRGALLALGHVGLVVTAIAGGAMLAYTAYKKAGEVDRGMSLEVVKSATLDMAQSLMGIGTALGGAAALANPFIGAGLAISCFAVSKGIDGLKWLLGGANWFRYPNLAPYGTRAIFRGLRNPSTMDGVK